MPEREPFVFVSYANSPPEHKLRVRQLVNQLRTRIKCVVDEDVETTGPPEGHERWSRAQLINAKYVLVVCSPEYGQGAGSVWESKIIDETLYKDRTLNYKFIPVLMDPDDEQYIPLGLSTANRYVVSNTAGYERLLAHLLSANPWEPAGRPDAKGQENGNSHAFQVAGEHRVAAKDVPVLLSLPDGRYRIIRAESILRGSNGLVEVHATTRFDIELGFLRSIQDQMEGRIGLAYTDHATQYRLRSVRRGAGPGKPWVIALQEEPVQRLTNGRRFDSDLIAELRTRRILLDERLDPQDPVTEVLEQLVRKCEIPCDFEILHSPIVELHSEWRGNRADFPAEARLAAVHHLLLSGTVEHVLRLDLSWAGDALLRVQFQGQRSRQYRNTDPIQIAVSGECVLR